MPGLENRCLQCRGCESGIGPCTGTSASSSGSNSGGNSSALSSPSSASVRSQPASHAPPSSPPNTPTSPSRTSPSSSTATPGRGGTSGSSSTNLRTPTTPPLPVMSTVSKTPINCSGFEPVVLRKHTSAFSTPTFHQQRAEASSSSRALQLAAVDSSSSPKTPDSPDGTLDSNSSSSTVSDTSKSTTDGTVTSDSNMLLCSKLEAEDIRKCEKSPSALKSSFRPLKASTTTSRGNHSKVWRPYWTTKSFVF